VVASVDTDMGYTEVSVATQPVAAAELLYTGGGVYANYFVPGDGGVATLGQRVWTASGSNVYASKLLTPGDGAAFNDEGGLYVTLPAGAGRVLALEESEGRLVILCEQGIWALADGGPDNTASGPEFGYPQRISKVGVAGPRSSCATDKGVVFCSPPDAADPHRGGPWLLGRNLGDVQYLGRDVTRYLGLAEPDVAWSPQRQQVYIACEDTSDLTGPGIIVLDLRASKWAVWDLGAVDLYHLECADGVLWAQETTPVSFSGAVGGGVEAAYPMTIKTSDMPADGKDGLGWSRVRSVSVLGTRESGLHTLTYTAELDGVRTLTGSDSIEAPTASTTWPTNRQAPEWRLPTQKCSTIAVQLSASPATAQWSAIRLDVVPAAGRAPAKHRS
jgi:hypothetical protein